MIDYSKCPKQCELNKKCYKDGYEQGFKDGVLSVGESIADAYKQGYEKAKIEFAEKYFRSDVNGY